jgi:hypothetical protein
MRIEEWFDIYNPDHLRAYRHLETTGMWPEGFIPENIKFSNIWQSALMRKFVVGFYAEYQKNIQAL